MSQLLTERYDDRIAGILSVLRPIGYHREAPGGLRCRRDDRMSDTTRLTR